ncbi:MAG: glutamate ligase domain-containing protein [Cytophagaceae bacterium]
MARDNVILAYYGELPDELAESLEQHLMTCEECQEELRSIQAMETPLAAFPVVEPSPNLLAQSRMHLDEALDAIPPHGFLTRLRTNFFSWVGHVQSAPALATLLVGVGFICGNFQQKGFGIQFSVNNIPFDIPVIGKHNMENATAAAAAGSAAGISIEDSAKALKTYVGIYRRTQLVGEKNGVTMIDDFAHNPSEVAAAIRTCQLIGKRVFAWFQPHGYGPLKFMHEELAEKVAETLRSADYLLLSDVYYAGGTVNKEVTSDVVIEKVKAKGKNAVLVADRKNLTDFFQKNTEKGDVILFMGARDPSLADFAKEVFEGLK